MTIPWDHQDTYDNRTPTSLLPVLSLEVQARVTPLGPQRLLKGGPGLCDVIFDYTTSG